MRSCLPLGVALVLAGCGCAPVQHDYVARLQALALLQTFNADLLSHDSATSTLEHWCGEHRLADPARIVARRVRDFDKPMPAQLRSALGVAPDEPIRYRHVQLVCGEHVLSEADNWYVPGRLTAEMNRQLEQTDESFGKVVRPLGFQRHTIAAEVLWQPLPAGWEMHRGNAVPAPGATPRDILRHTAVLYTATQVPFSTVVETYTNANLAFVR
jgi:hypothetical protein